MFLLQKLFVEKHLYIVGLQKEVASPIAGNGKDKTELEDLMKSIIFDRQSSSPGIVAGWTIHSVPVGEGSAQTYFESYTESLPGNGASVSDLPKYWACKLPTPRTVRGEVKKGFGRGAKSLGFPTANLELSDEVTAGMQRGIYAGFASVNGAEPHIAVVSVGINPCFNDVEKPLLEAYLVHEFESDFYGSELVLVAAFYLRPEWKIVDQDGNFSFSFLVATITNDVAVAVAALEFEDPSTYGFCPMPSPTLESLDPIDCLYRRILPMKASLLLAEYNNPHAILATSEGCLDVHGLSKECIGKPWNEVLGITEYQYGDLLTKSSEGKRFVCLRHRFVIGGRQLRAVFTMNTSDPPSTAHVNAYPYLSSLRYWLQNMIDVMLSPSLCMD
jgi:riboflavin kinase